MVRAIEIPRDTPWLGKRSVSSEGNQQQAKVGLKSFSALAYISFLSDHFPWRLDLSHRPVIPWDCMLLVMAGQTGCKHHLMEAVIF